MRPNFLLCLFLLVGLLSGCATAPKPKSVGQTVGSAIDQAITWSSQGIQKMMKRS